MRSQGNGIGSRGRNGKKGLKRRVGQGKGENFEVPGSICCPISYEKKIENNKELIGSLVVNYGIN
jgi:hypothetical protein